MKKLIKFIVIGLFYILIAPFGLSAKLVYIIFQSEVLFTFFAQFFSLVPGLPGNYVRLVFYLQTLRESHIDCIFLFGCIISHITAEIGRGVCIGAYANVGNYKIGDRSVIGNKASLLSGGKQHNFEDLNSPILDGTNRFEKLSIGSDVFVGELSVVMANIGDQTIVGAGSIVTKELPPRVIAVGNPCRPKKERR